MDVIYTQSAVDYKGNGIPEGKYRLEDIGRIGRKIGLQERDNDVPNLIHTGSHIRDVQAAGREHRFLAEVPTDGDTFEAAIISANLACRAAARNHFACTRPPGHHATGTVSKGFCFFNNMAIATQSLLNQNRRVCILDIDAHQGDGTEQIFYDTDQVLFFSVHEEFVYPYVSMEMDPAAEYDLTIKRRGSDSGEGFTYNVPVPSKCGDDIFLDIFRHFRATIIDYRPDIIGISAGFDGYFRDSLLNLNWTQSGYHQFGRLLYEMGIPVFGVLEGGYHRDVVACISALVAGVNGDPNPSDQDGSTSDNDLWDRYQEYINLINS